MNEKLAPGIKKKNRRKQKFDFVNVSFYSSAVSNGPRNDKVFKMEYRQPGLTNSNSNPSSSNNYSNPNENSENFPIFHWSIEKGQPLSNSPISSSSFSSLKSSETLLKTSNKSPKILYSAAEFCRAQLDDEHNLNYYEQHNDHRNAVAIVAHPTPNKSIIERSTSSQIDQHLKFAEPNNRIQRTKVFTISELLHQQ